MAKKKSAKRKNQISKHVLKSRQDDAKLEASDLIEGRSKSLVKRSNSTTKSNTKYPEDVALYLTRWKASKSEDPSIRASSSWKFNKNTQSWLIRHMYEIDKVPKSTFLLLLDYLKGLEGKFTINRITTDASRRCRRYKEYCKHNVTTSTTDTKEETGKSENRTDFSISNPDLGDGQNDDSTINRNKLSDRNAEIELEELLWRNLDDHQKRKQYKRARKILDMLKKSSSEKVEVEKC